MEVSTEFCSLGRLGGYREILSAIKEAGFTAFDNSMSWQGPCSEMICADDYLERAKALRAYADDIGLKCNQAHAPLTREVYGEYEYGEWGEELLRRALQISGIMGAKVCVIHPLKLVTVEENAAFYKRLEPYAREAGVKIGLENLWNWDKENDCAKKVACSHHENFKAHLEVLPEDIFVACVDTSHAGMKGLDTSPVQMIDALGKRVQALHLSDSDYRFDRHWLPFSLQYDFEEIIAALKRNGYQGDITFEMDKYYNAFPVELLPSVLRQTAEIGHYFKRKLEE